MELRHRLIRLALRGLAGAGADGWLPEAPDAAGIVVTLHHVRPASAAPFQPNANLSVTPQFLEDFILAARAAGWGFVPVADLLEEGEGRRMAVTLDDGFRDNAEHAWAVFRRHRVPFTVFVCPGFCDRAADLWWEALELVLAKADAIALEAEGREARRLAARTLAEKRAAFAAAARWLTLELGEDEARASIRRLAAAHGLDLATLAADLVMGWDEVRAVAADPLCAIGAHTMTHPALSRLAPDRALAEMRDSADRIEGEIGARPACLAFPYGQPWAAGPREDKLADAAGFAASFTTRPGYVPRFGPRHGLPRVSLNGHHQDAHLARLLVEPGLWRLRDRLRRR